MPPVLSNISVVVDGAANVVMALNTGDIAGESVSVGPVVVGADVVGAVVVGADVVVDVVVGADDVGADVEVPEVRFLVAPHPLTLNKSQFALEEPPISPPFGKQQRQPQEVEYASENIK